MFQKSLLLIVCFLIFLTTIEAQENYQKGHLISLKNDTVNGFIDYRNWNKNPDKINFKANLEANIETFTYLDINGFAVNGELYLSAEVPIEIIPSSQVDNLSRIKEIKTEPKRVFLQSIFQGEKSLFYFLNKQDKECFYIKQDEKYILLEYKKYLNTVEGRDFESENLKFSGQLAYYLQDCSKIETLLKNIKYKKESLEKLFENYLKCTNTNSNFHKKTEKIKVKVGGFVGLNSTKLNFKGKLDYIVETKYQRSFDANFGLNLEFILPRFQRKWSLLSEIMFTKYKANGKYEVYKNENDFQITSTQIGNKYIKLNGLVRYTYPFKGILVFGNFGLSGGFGFSEVNYLNRYTKLYTYENNNESLALLFTKNSEESLLLGIGLRFKHFSFEIRHEIGTGMSAVSSLNSITNRWITMIGYSF
jgi:Outer membrane protein beta-barrel domain